MAGKPAVKVYGKKKKTGSPDLPEYLDLAAFWVNDDGSLGGQWSRDIVKLRIKDRDGRTHDLDGESLKQYFCNLRDDRAAAPPRTARATSKPANDEPPPDFGDDDIPF